MDHVWSRDALQHAVINTEKKFLRAMKGGSFLVENKRLKINFEDAVPPESTDDGDGFRIGLVKIK